MAEMIAHPEYDRAHAVLIAETNELFDSGEYKYIPLLYQWAGETAKKTLSISPAVGASHIALQVCDGIFRLNQENLFDEIIRYGGKAGIESRVQTESKRYKAAIVISMYLDALGLN